MPVRFDSVLLGSIVGSIPTYSIFISPIPGGQDVVVEWFDSTMGPINYREVPMDKELKVSLTSGRVKLEPHFKRVRRANEAASSIVNSVICIN